jgi:hypothetical protein
VRHVQCDMDIVIHVHLHLQHVHAACTVCNMWSVHAASNMYNHAVCNAAYTVCNMQHECVQHVECTCSMQYVHAEHEAAWNR